MRVDDFLVERWMNKYEHNVEVNLAETCVKPFTLKEFLDFVNKPDFFEEFKDQPLTYGHIEGNPELRKGIADLYRNVYPENVLVTGGAIEANFNSFYSLIEPGDTVISIFPTYQQLYSVPGGFGATVRLLKLKPGKNWLPDLEVLKGLIDNKTKMIILNNPNNPCGSLMDESILKGICEIAEEVGAYVHCDEAYRGLYIKRNDSTPSIIDIYDRGIATGSFSKPFSLTGLRLGWITANEDTIHKCMLHRDYTTISKSMLDEALAALAMDYIDSILDRNNRIVRENYRILDDWVSKEPLIEWIPPRAGSVGFMQHSMDIPASKLCLDLMKEESTFLVPGDCFEQPDHIRIGYGNPKHTLIKGLKRLSRFLERYKTRK